MGLPREIIDEIMRYNNLQTLKACSLTSRSFYSAARPMIHKRLVLGMGSAIRGSSRKRLSSKVYLDQAEVFHARYLSAAEERGLLRYGYVQEVCLDLNISNPENVLQLQQLRALETVHTLTIERLNLRKILPVFDRCFSQFVPTLRSLRLGTTWCSDAHKFTEFICRFPRLDELALVNSFVMTDPDHILGLPSALPRPEGHRSQQLLPFHHRNTQKIAMVIGRWHRLQFVRSGLQLIATGCHWVPLVVIESRSWGSILILVLSIVILSFAL